jgi:ATP-dependent helicase/nuclease subunit A
MSNHPLGFLTGRADSEAVEVLPSAAITTDIPGGSLAPEGASPYLEGLNERQRDAVMAPANQALQVLAGAGTGKTELISRRFVKLVKELRAAGISRSEERILVVTFTSDAAAGMRERIHQRLLDNGEEGLGPGAWISTFHQFCMRLLRAHPLEVGLPPDFVILNSLQQQVVFNRVAHGVLAGEFSEISPVLEKYGLVGAVSPVLLSQPGLEKTGLDDLEALLEPSRLYKLISRIKSAGLSSKEFLEMALSQSLQLTECLKSMPLPHIDGEKPVENVLLKLQAWRTCLMPWAHDRWDPVNELARKAEETGKKLTASSYKAELPALAKLYLASNTFEPLSPDFTPLDEALALEKSSIALVAAIYALYQEALLAQGGCDFDDLINHAIALLENSPTLRARYRQKFEAIIVDEFQDSNGSQLRLLELLMREKAENITVVGDEKQSIYAFRFAQPENLDLIFRHGPYKKVNLQTNYRSRPPVLSVANALTEQITNRPQQQLDACERNALHQDPKVIWVNLDGMIDAGEGKFTQEAISVHKALEAQYIAVEIARLVGSGACKFSDIVVLVKSHAKAEAIQKALAGYNIPAIRQKNLGFFQESVIKDALALLRLVRNPSDELSLVRILQNKLNQRQIRLLMALRRTLFSEGDYVDGRKQSKLSLFETCLRLYDDPSLAEMPLGVAQAIGDLAFRLLDIRKQKGRLAPVQLFQKLAKVVGLVDPKTPAWRQKQQRITLRTFEKLLYLFSQNQPLQPTLDEVLETLEQYAADPSQELPVSEELSGEDAVRLMTVFASKGLEFPVVFCAYAEKGRSPGAGDDAMMLFDPQYAGKNGYGLILGKANGRVNLKREIYQKCWMTPRGALEAQRVFYVALTRAKERLYVIRGSHSPEWSAPDDYPRSAVEILSQSRHREALEALLWDFDSEALRQQMADLQERQKDTQASVSIPLAAQS